MQPDLLALAARVEALDGPDREVDAEVMFDLLASPVGKHKEDGGPIGYIRLDDQPSWNLGLRFPGKDRAWFAATRKQIKGETLLIERDHAFVLMNSMRVPPLTASVDAVLALIGRELPGWSWLMAWNGDATVCDVHPRPIGVVGTWPGHAKAATPALALLAAFLRAKAAQKQEADRG